MAAVNKTTGVRILGIESSCDETAAAVVVDGCRILSSIVASQIDIHRKYGGVVPELASREHLRKIVPVVREAMEQASVRFEDLDAIGVTQGPGLVGSLLVGITYGKTLATALGKPLIAVNHLEGHIHAAFLEAYREGDEPKLPAVCLIVSGGHTVLYEMRAREENNSSAAKAATHKTEDPGSGGGTEGHTYKKLGQTRDEGRGRRKTKVARYWGWGFRGGRISN